MADAAKIIHKLAGLHAAIAADICPDGAGHLECTECGKVQALTQADVAAFMRSGWPKCHRTMRWITARQEASR